jgi:apolipoprotein N-acyltransferase
VKVFSKKQLYLFSILSAILLWLGWPAHGFSFFLLIAFVPLLIIEEQLRQEGKKYRAIGYFKYAYTAMLLWNVFTTWWIWNATAFGASAAMVCNALFMALVLVLFHYVRMKTSARTGYASLVFLWITFEYIHLNWELSWPWLTLGNGFANFGGCVQWYEYTGVLGGTLWILICNILIFHILKYLWLSPWKGDKGLIKRTIIGAVALVFVPILLSVFMPFSNAEGKKVNVVLVQPNIDPYGEKFAGDFQAQLKKMLELADKEVDSATDYLVFPETALTENIDENRWNESQSMGILKDYLASHPRLSIVTGAESYKVYAPGEKVPESAHRIEKSEEFYDDYNTGIELNNSSPIQVYHKCKLVPGVEIMPFQTLLAPLAKLAFDLGGTSGTLGTQKEPSVFYSPASKTTTCAAICYESIYGEWIGKFVQKGAQLIFIITNDGWWKDTPGYKQHLSYARLRAIETRRCIARSANTGISCFIDENGNVSQQTSWWQPAVIKATLAINDKLTFYARYGDYIGWMASACAVLVLVFLFVTLFAKKNKPQNTTL